MKYVPTQNGLYLVFSKGKFVCYAPQLTSEEKRQIRMHILIKKLLKEDNGSHFI